MSTTGSLEKVSNLPTCITDWSNLLDLLVTKLRVTIPTATSYVLSDSTPSVSDQDKLWVKTVSGNLEGVYVYNDGSWLRKHETPASGSERRIFVGSLATLQTYDGGENAAVTDKTGPFWEEDTVFQQRFPLGVGTLPLLGTSVAVGSTGGVDAHALTVAELPTHSHQLSVNQYSNHDSSTGTPEQFLLANLSIASAGGVTPDVTVANAGSGDQHTNTPPYVGVYFIKRTARVYRRG
jgi:hypothetical protein